MTLARHGMGSNAPALEPEQSIKKGEIVYEEI